MISMVAGVDSPLKAMSVQLAGPVHLKSKVGSHGVSQDFTSGKLDDEHRNSRLKKPLAIRIDADLLAATRDCARRDNRSLTNFIETPLRRRVEEMMEAEPAPIAAAKKEHEA